MHEFIDMVYYLQNGGRRGPEIRKKEVDPLFRKRHIHHILSSS